MLAVVITVDRLAQQGDLGGPTLGERPDFGDDVTYVTAPLRPACIRNDAEGALIIAATLDCDERSRARGAHLRDVLIVLPRAEIGIRDTRTLRRHLHQIR